MSQRIKIVGIKNEKPDTKLFVLALLEFARQLQEEESSQDVTNRENVANGAVEPEAADG